MKKRDLTVLWCALIATFIVLLFIDNPQLKLLGMVTFWTNVVVILFVHSTPKEEYSRIIPFLVTVIFGAVFSAIAYF